MYNFIVLGIVPGTDLQIDFDMWLKLLEMAVLVYAVFKLKIVHQTLAGQTWVRRPLHASQLHLRG
jgi:hypothetical protein